MTRIITRREWLTRGLGVVGAGAALPSFLVRSALSASPSGSGDRVVVSLLLTGGPDGLSLAPPIGHKEYYQVRPTLALSDKVALRLNDEVGLHPKLAGFKQLSDQGQMALVLGAGYPNFNLSHFTSRDIWESATTKDQTGRKGSTGWMGRCLDQVAAAEKGKIMNVAVGPGRFPLIVTAKEFEGIGFESPESFRFDGLLSRRGRSRYLKMNQGVQLRPDAPKAEELQFITRTAASANQASETIRELAGEYRTSVAYPETQFGSSVRAIAGLINGGLPARMYYAAQGIAVFGGYDTHAEQMRRLDLLLDELSQTMLAFYQDLKRCGNDQRVLTFTFSEFGRRVGENYSGGTDHGLAQPMFVFGPGVRGGVYGKQPSLTELDDRGNLKMEVDFRSVYRAILEKWLGTPAQPILGAEYPLLDCIA